MAAIAKTIEGVAFTITAWYQCGNKGIRLDSTDGLAAPLFTLFEGQQVWFNDPKFGIKYGQRVLIAGDSLHENREIPEDWVAMMAKAEQAWEKSQRSLGKKIAARNRGGW